jgi:2-polyprenyl-3-methyl-5-hydroxy-6-metoxy-1,4-benzoquinol methylase
VTSGNSDYLADSVLEDDICNICGSNDYWVVKLANYSHISSVEDFYKNYSSSSDSKLSDQLVKCKNCRLVYVNPRVKNVVSLTGYQEAVDPRHHEEDHYRMLSFKRAIKKIEKYILEGNKPKSKIRILDVGCAGGAFPKTAIDLGYRAIGIEPSKYLAAHGRRTYNLDVRAETLEEFSLEPELFSVISFWDVLEHVPNPKKTLQLAHAMLEDPGVIILNLPMIDTFPAKMLGKYWPFYLNVHFFYFEIETISKLLDSLGYEIVQKKRYWQTLSFGYVLTRVGINLPFELNSKLSFPIKYYLGQRTIIAKQKTNV